MDHKEYSSGGSEFFPAGQEFSSAQQEFPKLSPEIIPVSAESDQSGSEFHQSSGPEKKTEKKRRRNISPAMLTTAAVVTAAVIVSPLSSFVGRYHYPNLELSARSKAYLDEVWEALPEGDTEQLIDLARDERFRTLALEETGPYLEAMESKYGLEIHPDDCDWCNNPDQYSLQEGHHYYSLRYDGETVDFENESTALQWLYFDYNRYAYADSPENISLVATFDLVDYDPDTDTYESQRASINIYEYDDESEGINVYYENGLWEGAQIEDFYYSVLKRGYISHTYTDREQTYITTAEGEFAVQVSPSDDQDYEYELTPYLDNGTFTISETYLESPQQNYSVQLQVIDGVVQLADGMYINYDESSGIYDFCMEWVDESTGTSHQAYLHSAKAGSEEEFLHTSSWYRYIFSSIYYFAG